MRREPARDLTNLLAPLGQWLLLGGLVGVLCGGASALFLFLLARATELRVTHETWLVPALPLAGLALGALHRRYGEPIRGGNNLVLDTIHDDGPELPLRMAPMVLVGTVLTHLFGGSAGREGTAVQMGAGLSDWLAHRLGVDRSVRRQLLAAGVAGGFGSVFGTPVAGTLFGMEFLTLGRIEYEALVPALAASLVGDLVARGLGTVHTAYTAAPSVPMEPLLMAKWLVFAAAVAMASTAFVEATHLLKQQAERWFPSLPARMMVGGVVLVGMWWSAGTGDYLGLGLPTISRAFDDPSLPAAAFALKILFTAVTLAVGFPGGEVTPLFFVGAALGNLLGQLLGIPLPLAAGVGMASVFATAANTPLALSVMAAELLGVAVLPHVLPVAVVAYLLAGHRGIYPAQRLLRKKTGQHLGEARALRDWHRGA